MKAATALCLTLALICNPHPAYAWSGTGHRTVALIAQMRLSPTTLRMINRLLALEPGSSFMSIANWADENRDSNTARWHYINFPRDDCHYRMARDCPDGECVVEAIKVQQAIFHSTVSDAEKLRALKFLVHLVGDIHQPLHAGFGDDRGGNTYNVELQRERSNLHGVWDHQMVGQLGRSPAAIAHLILADQTIDRSEPIPASDVDVTAWAEQSCRIVERSDFYPAHRISEAYLHQFAQVTELQLLRAGNRLANLLNN